jgi:hypothetical protein
MAMEFASAQRRRLLTVGALVLAALLVPAAASRAAAVASFSYSPAAPLTGQTVTLTSTSTGTVTSETWDLDNNGFCDDAEGHSIQRAFPTAGQYGIWLCVNNSSKQLQTITVLNRPPTASFTYSPADPVIGQPVTLTSTSLDPDGPLVGEDWALGVLGNASATTVTRSWSVPGVYPVTLQVTDRNGAGAAATRWIPIHHKPLRLLSPFPVVRLVGRVTAKGTEVKLLTVQAPRGARVSVRCHGRACPYRRAGARSRGAVKFRRLQRLLPAGTVLELSVTKRGTIGKYTRFRIRDGHSPARVDRCLKAGAKRPTRCPSS